VFKISIALFATGSIPFYLPSSFRVYFYLSVIFPNGVYRFLDLFSIFSLSFDNGQRRDEFLSFYPLLKPPNQHPLAQFQLFHENCFFAIFFTVFYITVFLFCYHNLTIDNIWNLTLVLLKVGELNKYL